MKTYLLSEDLIERMLACAINTGHSMALTQHGKESYEMIPEWLKNPDESARGMAIVVLKKMKKSEIIEPINQN